MTETFGELPLETFGGFLSVVRFVVAQHEIFGGPLNVASGPALNVASGPALNVGSGPALNVGSGPALQRQDEAAA